MNAGLHRFSLVRVELWHGLLLLTAMTVLLPLKLVQILPLLLGALFMALNFSLLYLGVRWLLASPAGGKKRIGAGLFLLILKSGLFLGLLLALFYRYQVDAVSFALGVSCLLVAVAVESVLVREGRE